MVPGYVVGSYDKRSVVVVWSDSIFLSLLETTFLPVVTDLSLRGSHFGTKTLCKRSQDCRRSDIVSTINLGGVLTCSRGDVLLLRNVGPPRKETFPVSRHSLSLYSSPLLPGSSSLLLGQLVKERFVPLIVTSPLRHHYYNLLTRQGNVKEK